MTRLRQAVEDGQISADADLGAVADALIGTLLLHALAQPGPKGRFDGLVDAMLNGVRSPS